MRGRDELSALRADFFQRIDLIINKMEISILLNYAYHKNRKDTTCLFLFRFNDGIRKNSNSFSFLHGFNFQRNLFPTLLFHTVGTFMLAMDQIRKFTFHFPVVFQPLP